MPRKSYQPSDADRKIVKALAAYGVPQEDIAARVGCSHVTLRKHYPGELKHGSIEANAKVAERLFADCLKDAPAYQVSRFFWLKTRARWRERVEVEAVKGEELVARLTAGRQRAAKAKVAKAE